jgi:hypothetical protein
MNYADVQAFPPAAAHTQRITNVESNALRQFFKQIKIGQWENLKQRKKPFIEELIDQVKEFSHLNFGQIDRQLKSYLANIDYCKDLGKILHDKTILMIEGDCPIAETSMKSILGEMYQNSIQAKFNLFPSVLFRFLERCHYSTQAQDDEYLLSGDKNRIRQFELYYRHVLLKVWAGIWREQMDLEDAVANDEVTAALAPIDTSFNCMEKTLIFRRQDYVSNLDSTESKLFFSKTCLLQTIVNLPPGELYDTADYPKQDSRFFAIPVILAMNGEKEALKRAIHGLFDVHVYKSYSQGLGIISLGKKSSTASCDDSDDSDDCSDDGDDGDDGDDDNEGKEKGGLQKRKGDGVKQITNSKPSVEKLKPIVTKKSIVVGSDTIYTETTIYTTIKQYTTPTDDINIGDSSSEVIQNQTKAIIYYLAGFTVLKVAGIKSLHPIIAKFLENITFFDIVTASLDGLPTQKVQVALAKSNMKTNVVCVNKNLFLELFRLEIEVIGPILASTSLLLSGGQNICRYLKSQVEAHNSYDAITDIIGHSIIEQDGIISESDCKIARIEAVQKFFEVYINICGNDLVSAAILRKWKNADKCTNNIAFRYKVKLRQEEEEGKKKDNS